MDHPHPRYGNGGPRGSDAPSLAGRGCSTWAPLLAKHDQVEPEDTKPEEFKPKDTEPQPWQV